MRDFFHGWRRKTGVVTLVMACLLMASWISSRQTASWTMLCPDRFNAYFLQSYNQLLSGKHLHEPNGIIRSRRQGIIAYRINEHGDYAALGDGQLGEHLPNWSIPHLAVVCPLTLLSAFLILWKPRKRESPPT